MINPRRKRRKKIEESENVQTTPTRTYCKRDRTLPYKHPNCRTPRQWKFTLDHRTTRPPPSLAVHFRKAFQRKPSGSIVLDQNFRLLMKCFEEICFYLTISWDCEVKTNAFGIEGMLVLGLFYIWNM